MTFDPLGEIQLEVANQRVVITYEFEVCRDTFARTCVGELFGDTFPVGPIGDPAFRPLSVRSYAKWSRNLIARQKSPYPGDPQEGQVFSG